MKHLATLSLAVAVCAFSCKKDEAGRQPDTTYNPVIEASNFTKGDQLTNPYVRFEAGKKYIYEGQKDGAFERIEVQLLAKNKSVMGIACAVVNDKVWINGKLVEDTDDWYAQDNAGNVWYMGEYVTDYNPDGTVADHDGSWEAGVDGAKPGINMLADPKVGMAYRQEYYFDEAEDEAKVIETGLNVTVPVGTFSNCIKIEEWTALEPGIVGYKTYAPGVGIVKDGDQILLVKIE